MRLHPKLRAGKVRLVAFALGLLAVTGRPATAQAANPDFDTAPWRPLICDVTPATAFDARAEINLVGDVTFPAAYVARDGTYLFLRYRVDADPSGLRGFAGSSNWTTVVQAPTGNAFQYQNQLSLNGDSGAAGDTIEIWSNSTPESLAFNPVFTDNAETKVFSQVYNVADPASGNTSPLARSLPAGDGSGFGGDPDWFVDTAFPISVLVAKGVITTAGDLDQTLFWPATASLPNRHNKDYLNCPLVPATTLTVAGSVTPTLIGANATTAVRYTITARDGGSLAARGVVITHPALPAYFSNVRVSVTADDPRATWTVIGQNPLGVRAPTLPPGATLIIRIDADAAPGCGAPAAPTTAIGFATNAGEAAADLLLQVGEVCDGVDNDCDGQTDEGAGAQCDDGRACNGTEVCGGVAGCQPGPPPDCDDHDACTTDGCEDAGGCFHTPISGCASCRTVADCAPGNACTAAACPAGLCTYAPILDCVPCVTASQCGDTDPCTDDVCSAGACEHQPRPACVPCTPSTDCDDGNSCTTDACGADGTCARTVIPGCRHCSTESECGDGDACTTDACVSGVCGHVPIAGCTTCVSVPEVCGDGTDNDCDALTDCNDPDCVGVPACTSPPAEICGNCADDDGDGLVDGEDPDCCANPEALAVDRIRLRPADVKVRGDRLRLATRWAATTPPLFDPLRQDTSLMLSDAGGPLFCTTISPDHWRRVGLAYRFTDRGGRFAGGLQSGEFRVNRDGNVLFGTHGRGVALRPIAAGDVRITVRVGRKCSQSSMTLRSGRKGLVFP